MHTRLATAHLGTPDDDMNENGKDEDNGLETHFFSSFFIYFTNDYLQINMVGLLSPTTTHHLSTATYATSATLNAHQQVMTTCWWVAFLLPPLRHLWTTNNHLCHLHPQPTAFVQLYHHQLHESREDKRRTGFRAITTTAITALNNNHHDNTTTTTTTTPAITKTMTITTAMTITTTTPPPLTIMMNDGPHRLFRAPPPPLAQKHDRTAVTPPPPYYYQRVNTRLPPPTPGSREDER